MAEDWPKIRARRTTRVSPWVELIERDVEFAPGEPVQVYHAVGQADYIAILAITPDGRIPIVRQYRPALEAFTWELPAGLVDPGEDPAETCRRELLEETGFTTRSVRALGSNVPCSGRLSNRVHSFFVETGERSTDFTPERDLTVDVITQTELVRLIKAGEFVQQLHIGTLLMAELQSLLKLPR